MNAGNVSMAQEDTPNQCLVHAIGETMREFFPLLGLRLDVGK